MSIEPQLQSQEELNDNDVSQIGKFPIYVVCSYEKDGLTQRNAVSIIGIEGRVVLRPGDTPPSLNLPDALTAGPVFMFSATTPNQRELVSIAVLTRLIVLPINTIVTHDA